MPLRSRHGRARQFGTGPVIELVADELAVGVAGPARPASAPKRDPGGRFVEGDPAVAELGRRGGFAKATAAAELTFDRTLEDLLDAMPSTHPARPFIERAVAWSAAALVRLAARVGGGELGPLPIAAIKMAAKEKASADWFSFLAWRTPTETEYFERASRAGQVMKAHLLAAHELAAREAATRPEGNQTAEVRAQLVGPEEPRR